MVEVHHDMTTPQAPQRPTTLAIVGDTLHHVDDEGRLCTHAALAAQLSLWAEHFDRVRFCGVLGSGPPPPGFAPYDAPNVELVELPRAGGSGLKAKFTVLIAAGAWLRTMVPVLRAADGVHLRTPCNVTILGLIVSRVLVKNRYAIFAGSWDAYAGEPATYRLQRWLLRWWFGGTVHAYVSPARALERPNVRPAFSPVLTEERLDELSTAAHASRSAEPPAGAERRLRLVCVGRFSANKNQIALVEALRELQAGGTDVECRIIGDGAELSAVKLAAHELRWTTFVAHASREEVFATMAWADLNVLPSFREGFPKVLLEGMCVGALPVAADTPMNRDMVDGRGWIFAPRDSSSLARLLIAAVDLPAAEWADRRDRCVAYAREHTLDAFADEVEHIVHQTWHVPATGHRAETPPS